MKNDSFIGLMHSHADLAEKYDKLLDEHIKLLKDYTTLIKDDIIRIEGEELLETLIEEDGEEWKGRGLDDS